MNFLYPQFLFALFALAIPIIIHLFHFRRTKKVYFSNTRFLQKVKEASSSKVKLKHYLILFSRLLFIFFLVVAFAQPIIQPEDEIRPQNDVYIYFDNSYSMSNEVDESLSAFDAGIAYIDEFIGLLPPATSYRFMTNDFDASSTVSKSQSEISDKLTEMQYSSSSRSFSEILNRIESQTNIPENIYWISDFQRSMASADQLVVDSSYAISMVPMQFMSTKNVAVDSIWLANPFIIGDQNLQLNLKLKNYGIEEVNDLIIKVFVDEVQSATASVSIPANLTEEVSFDLAFELEGINKCRISFEEFPVTFDNDFYFTINGSQRINVLEIKQTDKITNVASVYGNEELFNLSSVNISNLDYSLIEQNDLLVINQLDVLEPSLMMVLNEYITENGNVLIIPSATPDITSYQQLFGIGQLSLKDTLIRTDLATPDFDNPFFQEVFEERSRNIAMPSAQKVLDWGRDRTAILSFRNGEPFLSKVGERSNIYLLASPLELPYSTFQTHALFVPVMYRLALQSASADNRLYYFTDEKTITFRSDTLIRDEVYKLLSKTGEVIPSQRIQGNSVIMEIPTEMLEAGFYDLMLSGNRVNTLAFNKNFEESNLEQLSLDEIRQKFEGNIAVINASDSASFKKEIENRYLGTPLWKYALIFALIFLLVEILLIRFFP